MLTLLTLNLNEFGRKHGTWEQRQERLLRVLQTHRPDIVALQAVGAEAGTLADQNQARQIALRMPEYTHTWFQEAQRTADDRVHGSAFLARTALTPVSRQALPYEDNAEDTNRRILLHARAQDGDNTLNIVNAHFSWVPALNLGNVVAALAYLNTLSGATLLLGDMNAPPDSGGMRLLAEFGWTDVWARLRPDDPGFTFESDAPAQRIDYVWANTAALARVQAIDRLLPAQDERLSDHLPLLVTLD